MLSSNPRLPAMPTKTEGDALTSLLALTIAPAVSYAGSRTPISKDAKSAWVSPDVALHLKTQHTYRCCRTFLAASTETLTTNHMTFSALAHHLQQRYSHILGLPYHLSRPSSQDKQQRQPALAATRKILAELQQGQRTEHFCAITTPYLASGDIVWGSSPVLHPSEVIPIHVLSCCAPYTVSRLPIKPCEVAMRGTCPPVKSCA